MKVWIPFKTIIFFSLSYQLKSNVVSLDSHIGQYAVICERQRQEVIWNKQHYHAPSFLMLKISQLNGHRDQWFIADCQCSVAFLKILQLKQKLKAYEEKNMVPGASNMISSQKQAEFKR